LVQIKSVDGRRIRDVYVKKLNTQEDDHPTEHPQPDNSVAEVKPTSHSHNVESADAGA